MEGMFQEGSTEQSMFQEGSTEQRLDGRTIQALLENFLQEYSADIETRAEQVRDM